MPRISARLRAVAEMVAPGSRVCDVGCDHALTSIYLVRSGRVPSALAMDVAEGPLRSAAGNLEAYGCGQLVELRLSDGLEAYREGEADCLILSGMGGLLILSILEAFPAKTRSFAGLVLGPQREYGQLRAGLRLLGLEIAAERMVEEDGKFYPILLARPGRRQGAETAAVSAASAAASLAEVIEEAGTVAATKASSPAEAIEAAETAAATRAASPAEVIEAAGTVAATKAASPAEAAETSGRPDERKSGEKASASAEALPQRIRDAYGPCLLESADPVLVRYLHRQRRLAGEILQQLGESGRARKRREEIEAELADLSLALRFIDGRLSANGADGSTAEI